MVRSDADAVHLLPLVQAVVDELEVRDEIVPSGIPSGRVPAEPLPYPSQVALVGVPAVREVAVEEDDLRMHPEHVELGVRIHALCHDQEVDRGATPDSRRNGVVFEHEVDAGLLPRPLRGNLDDVPIPSQLAHVLLQQRGCGHPNVAGFTMRKRIPDSRLTTWSSLTI